MAKASVVKPLPRAATALKLRAGPGSVLGMGRTLAQTVPGAWSRCATITHALNQGGVCGCGSMRCSKLLQMHRQPAALICLPDSGLVSLSSSCDGNGHSRGLVTAGATSRGRRTRAGKGSGGGGDSQGGAVAVTSQGSGSGGVAVTTVTAPAPGVTVAGVVTTASANNIVATSE